MANEMTRRSPFREMANMQTVFDRFFDDWRPFFNDENMPNGSLLAINAHEDDKQYTVTTELPGVKAEDINIRQDGDYLLIEADIPDQMTEKQDQRWLVRERRSGHFSRRIRLPQNVDFDKADADYHDGVLTLTLPKAANAQPRQIQVKTTNGGSGNGNGKSASNTVSGSVTKSNSVTGKAAETSTKE